MASHGSVDNGKSDESREPSDSNGSRRSKGSSVAEALDGTASADSRRDTILHDLVMQLWDSLPTANQVQVAQTPRPRSEIIEDCPDCGQTASSIDQTCLGKDLPTLLDRIEEKMGRAFLPPDARAQYEDFAHSDECRETVFYAHRLYAALSALTRSSTPQQQTPMRASDADPFTLEGDGEAEEGSTSPGPPSVTFPRSKSVNDALETFASADARGRKHAASKIPRSQSTTLSMTPPQLLQRAQPPRRRKRSSQSGVPSPSTPINSLSPDTVTNLSSSTGSLDGFPRPETPRNNGFDNPVFDSPPIDEQSYHSQPPSGLEPPLFDHDRFSASRQLRALSSIASESSLRSSSSTDPVDSARVEELVKKHKLSEEAHRRDVDAFETRQLHLQSTIDQLEDTLRTTRLELGEAKKASANALAKLETRDKDVEALEKKVEAKRELHKEIKHKYQEQLNESEKLREDVRAKELAALALEEEVRVAREDAQKLARDCALLEERIKETDRQLDVARKAEEYLQSQKDENMALKEEIDRLRLDLDTAQSRLRNVSSSSSSLSRSASSEMNSPPTSMSRTLGGEIQRRLMDSIASRSDDEDTVAHPMARRALDRSPSGSSFTEETVLRVRRKRGHRRTEDIALDAGNSLEIELADAGLQAAPLRQEQSTQTSSLQLRSLLAQEAGLATATIEAAIQRALEPPPYSSHDLKTQSSSYVDWTIFSNPIARNLFIITALLAILIALRVTTHDTCHLMPPSYYRPDDEQRPGWIQQLAFTFERYAYRNVHPTRYAPI